MSLSKFVRGEGEYTPERKAEIMAAVIDGAIARQCENRTTVDEAIQELTAISNSGGGLKPLQIQIVEDGLTFAADCRISEAQDYDGNMVWVYPTNKIAPKWL